MYWIIYGNITKIILICYSIIFYAWHKPIKSSTQYFYFLTYHLYFGSFYASVSAVSALLTPVSSLMGVSWSCRRTESMRQAARDERRLNGNLWIAYFQTPFHLLTLPGSLYLSISILTVKLQWLTALISIRVAPPTLTHSHSHSEGGCWKRRVNRKPKKNWLRCTGVK